jgi:hypothetical protein
MAIIPKAFSVFSYSRIIPPELLRVHSQIRIGAWADGSSRENLQGSGRAGHFARFQHWRRTIHSLPAAGLLLSESGQRY